MKIYISGKITDNPGYQKEFHRAEMYLKTIGHDTKNPCNNKGPGYRECINQGLKDLMECDAIYMLRGWETSKGANLEHHYAAITGMAILYEGKEETDRRRAQKHLKDVAEVLKISQNTDKNIKESVETILKIAER